MMQLRRNYQFLIWIKQCQYQNVKSRSYRYPCRFETHSFPIQQIIWTADCTLWVNISHMFGREPKSCMTNLRPLTILCWHRGRSLQPQKGIDGPHHHVVFVDKFTFVTIMEEGHVP